MHGYFIELVGKSSSRASVAQSLESLSKGSSDSLGLRFARELGQRVRQSLGFFITDIQRRHVSPRIVKLLHSITWKICYHN